MTYNFKGFPSFAHCVHLNTILEMCSSIHMWPQDNNKNLGQEVASKERKHTDEDGTHVCCHSEGAPAQEVDGKEGHPGDHVYHEAEGDTLGFIIICRQVLAHVAESKAEYTE